MASINCHSCPYYSSLTGRCIYLGKPVPNPNEPLCIKLNKIPPGLSKILKPSNTPPSQTRPQPANPLPLQNTVPTTHQPAVVQIPVPQAPSQTYEETLDARVHTDRAFVYWAEPDQFVPTGIPKLDSILGGGFLRGKTYLVAGETGCGKTIFSLQYLLHGAQMGEPGLYIAIDEPTSQLAKGIKRFGWDVTPLVKQRKLLFLDMRVHFSKIYLRDERRKIEPRYIIEAILKNIRRIKARRLVIDPIAPLMYSGSTEDVLYAREFLREMVFAIESLESVTTIMTSEIPTGSKQLSRFGVEEFLASGIIVLSIEEIGGKIERVMYIRKARWAPVKPVKYVFDIVPGVGIVLRKPLSEYKLA